MQLYQKKQQVLDLETELLAKEEQLSERQRHLEEYEKEVRACPLFHSLPKLHGIDPSHCVPRLG